MFKILQEIYQVIKNINRVLTENKFVYNFFPRFKILNYLIKSYFLVEKKVDIQYSAKLLFISSLTMMNLFPQYPTHIKLLYGYSISDKLCFH